MPVDRVWEDALDSQNFATYGLGRVRLHDRDVGFWFAILGCWSRRLDTLDALSLDAAGCLDHAIHRSSIGKASGCSIDSSTGRR